MNKTIIAILSFFGVIIGLYFYINSLKTSISDLTLANQVLKTEMVNKNLSNERLKTSLSNQNKEIERQKTEKKSAVFKLNEWKKLPPKIRYKVIYKTKEIKSNECKDIKDRLDAVRSIDFSKLY